MKHYSDLSESECRTREYFSDRVTELKEARDCLRRVEEIMEGEGLWLHGTLLEMINVVGLAIRGLEDEALEEGI